MRRVWHPRKAKKWRLLPSPLYTGEKTEGTKTHRENERSGTLVVGQLPGSLDYTAVHLLEVRSIHSP